MAASAGVPPSTETSPSITTSPPTTIFVLCFPPTTQISTPVLSPTTSSFVLPTTQTLVSSPMQSSFSLTTTETLVSSFTLSRTLNSSPFLITSTSTSTTFTTSSGKFNATTSSLSQSLQLNSSSQVVSSGTQVQTTPSLSGPANQATSSSPNNGDQNLARKSSRDSIAVAVVGTLVPLFICGAIGVLFIRWRRRRRARAVTERAHRFYDISLDSHMHLRRGETNDALPMNKTLLHRRTLSRREDADRSDSGPQPQLAEESLAFRIGIRKLEDFSIMHSSALEADTPPDYEVEITQ